MSPSPSVPPTSLSVRLHGTQTNQDWFHLNLFLIQLPFNRFTWSCEIFQLAVSKHAPFWSNQKRCTHGQAYFSVAATDLRVGQQTWISVERCASQLPAKDFWDWLLQGHSRRREQARHSQDSTAKARSCCTSQPAERPRYSSRHTYGSGGLRALFPEGSKFPRAQASFYNLQYIWRHLSV